MALVAVLVVTNLITGLTVFYLAAPAPAPTPTTVRVIGPWAGPERDAFLPVMDLFTRTTGIRYEYVQIRQEALQTILPTQFEAQRAPGDLIFMPSAFIKDYGTEGHAVDLATTIGAGNYAPGALDSVKVGNAIYGGAYTGKVKPGFWYRISFFEANGLSVPTSWTEFVALLQAIQGIPGIQNAIISGDGVGWPLSDVTEHFLASYGTPNGPAMNRALIAKTLSWTDPSVRTVFADRLVPTLQAGYWSEPLQWDTGVQSWWDGDYGLYFMGSWITGMVADPSDLGVFSLPVPEGTTTGIVFAADFFFVPRYATNATAARQLAAFLASAPAQTMQVRQGGHIATVTGVPLTAYPAVDARVAALLGGREVLPDLDDTIGGTFQTTFWSQLQLLWSDPSQLDGVLAAIQAAAA